MFFKSIYGECKEYKGTSVHACCSKYVGIDVACG